jgi:toxin FitB
VIILDTNVLSELSRQDPSQRVVSWLDSQPTDQTATTAVTAAELRYGVARLPEGRRKAALTDVIAGILDHDLAGRVEPFDASAAVYYAVIVSARERAGRPIGVADAQIASICCSLRALLATRNTSDFEDTGIQLIDPWQA